MNLIGAILFVLGFAIVGLAFYHEYDIQAWIERTFDK